MCSAGSHVVSLLGEKHIMNKDLVGYSLHLTVRGWLIFYKNDNSTKDVMLSIGIQT